MGILSPATTTTTSLISSGEQSIDAEGRRRYIRTYHGRSDWIE